MRKKNDNKVIIRHKKTVSFLIAATGGMKVGVKAKELYKEMDLIQGCISRMADNSFRLKEWYISLIALAVVVMLGQQFELNVVGLFLLGVTIVFWGLDAFYLKMETLYRWKYEWVIVKRKAGECSHLYNLDPYNKNMWINADGKREQFIGFIFSKTLTPLYGTVMVLAVVLLWMAMPTG